MGMFDSYIIETKCPDCGTDLKSIQSKAGVCDLEEYKLGDKVNFGQGFYVDTAILEEEIYCDCGNPKWKALIFIDKGQFCMYQFIERND